MYIKINIYLNTSKCIYIYKYARVAPPANTFQNLTLNLCDRFHNPASLSSF